MKYVFTVICWAALTALMMQTIPSANADEAWLGLRTYHFDRTPSGCRDETHHLYAYRRGSYHVGTYSNSQCMRSYVLGYSYDWKHGFGLDLSLVSGYPSSMHVLSRLVLIPQLTYSAFYGKLGVKFIYVPTVLVGTGIAIKF